MFIENLKIMYWKFQSVKFRIQKNALDMDNENIPNISYLYRL